MRVPLATAVARYGVTIGSLHLPSALESCARKTGAPLLLRPGEASPVSLSRSWLLAALPGIHAENPATRDPPLIRGATRSAEAHRTLMHVVTFPFVTPIRQMQAAASLTAV